MILPQSRKTDPQTTAFIRAAAPCFIKTASCLCNAFNAFIRGVSLVHLCTLLASEGDKNDAAGVRQYLVSRQINPLF